MKVNIANLIKRFATGIASPINFKQELSKNKESEDGGKDKIDYSRLIGQMAAYALMAYSISKSCATDKIIEYIASF